MPDDITVLHVDDDPKFAELTATFLEREDDRFDVETAASADEGLQRIRDGPPDCVVSDYNMPGLDGLEFLQAVRENSPDLPFILFTGKGSEAVASEAIAADVTDYLQKGSGSEQYELLTNRVRNAVEARRETQRADRQEQLMRLTEFAGNTGGFELNTEAGELTLTDGASRLVDLPSQAELSLQEAIELFHPADGADIRQTINRACRTGEQTHGTWRLQPEHGNERIVDVTVTPATTDGDTEVLRGAIHDVTDKHERRRELKRERRFITQALDALDDLFYVVNTDGTLRRWNETGPEVTGYSHSELDSMPVVELFPEEERESVARALEAALTDGELRLEAELLTADGQRIPCEFRGARLTDGDGTPTGVVGIGRDLTGRRQRERRFRALVEESNDVISIVDADGRYQYQSPSLERVLGHDPEETVGDTAWEYIHPDDRERTLEAFETWVKDPSRTLERVEYRARHADGSWRWMEAEGNNQLDNPAVEGYVVNSRDITDRKERQRELQQIRDLLSNMEELADAGAWEYSSETEQLMITDGARRLYGLDPGADLTLDAALDAVHPDDRALLADRLGACLETGEPYETEIRLTPANGGQQWLTVRGERVTGGVSGDAVRGYIQDITERREREQELRELKSQYETLAESFPDGAVFLINTELEYIRAGGKELSRVGLSPDDVEGKNPHALFPEAIADDLCHHYEEALAGNANTFEQEYEGKRYRIQTTPVRTDSEGIEYVMAVSQNVSERVADKRELERQNERLAEFASIVSHDLRNPLQVADGRLELIREDCKSAHIDDVARALDRMDALIADLLTLAQEGEHVDETERVGLANVAKSSWQTVNTEQATLEVGCSRAVRADRSRLRQLLENLYRNAVEHGGDDVTVSVGATDGGFYVADTGPGIPESDREAVFEAGYSTSAEGTGFGLRTVEQIAEAHGWEITVTESDQGGARFELTGVEFAEH